MPSLSRCGAKGSCRSVSLSGALVLICEMVLNFFNSSSRRPVFTDHNACCDVGEVSGCLKTRSGPDRSRKRRYGWISGAGYIVDFPGHRRNVDPTQATSRLLEQRHAIAPTRYQEGLQVESCGQMLRRIC